MKYLSLVLLSSLAHAAPVIVYQDHPIIKDQTITVDTYYDDARFDGFHTIIYSTLQPHNLFFHQVNFQSIDIVHQWAKCWITNQILQQMLQNMTPGPQLNCTQAQRINVTLDLYDISEEDDCDCD